MTFLYGVLDNETRTFDYCNAGNVYPILVSQGTARSIEAGGAALGVFPEWKYENATIALEPDDRLLLVTDGITEAYGSDEQEFGEERLALAALAASKRTAAEMSRLLLEEVSTFCGSRFHDEMRRCWSSRQSEEKFSRCGPEGGPPNARARQRLKRSSGSGRR